MYPHGTVIDWSFTGIPEQFCGPNQFINCTWGKGMQIQDINHPDNADYLKTINSIRTFSPNKGKKMNANPNTNTVDQTEDVVRSYYDENGERIIIPFDTDGAGEAAPTETTVYIAADEADHPVTVH